MLGEKIMPKIKDPKQVKYIALEGGGGKGFAYLGAILALEELGILPIKNNALTNNEEGKGILGISGASAGAITALMLAMGLTSSKIKAELSNSPGKFDVFFDDPKPNLHRKVTSNNKLFFYANPLLIEHRNKVQKPLDEIIQKTTKFIRIISLLKRVYNIAKGEKLNTSPNAIFKKVFEEGKLGQYILNLIYDFGLFPGIEVRKYFANFMDDHLVDLRPANIKFEDPKPTGSKVSFREFAKRTSIDLVITGTNVTLHRPRLFSREHTPNFPVSEAVGLSMNLPLLFKPIYIDSLDANYKGFWCDGGVLNNLPIHAFDKQGESLNPNMLALRLTVGTHPSYEDIKNILKIAGIDLSSNDETKSILDRFLGYLSDLWETFCYPSEEGQIRSPSEAKQTIHLYTFDLSLTEFSPPANKQLLPVLFAHKSVYDYFGKKWKIETELSKIMKLINK